MQTATLKEATEKLGVSLSDMVRYHTLGNQAIIQIDLEISLPNNADNFKPAQFQAPNDAGRRISAKVSSYQNYATGTL